MVDFRAMPKWSNGRDEYNDVHDRLMREYKEAPEWWYLCILDMIGYRVNQKWHNRCYNCIGMNYITVVLILFC